MSRRELGNEGEKLACGALKKKGYRIVEKNYRCLYGEIDIIATQKDCLVFIEVRSKSGTSFGLPEESITSQKKQRLVSTAMYYLGAHEEATGDWRIDFVAIEFDESGKKARRIEIIENALS
jgi:putative endonuclease